MQKDVAIMQELRKVRFKTRVIEKVNWNWANGYATINKCWNTEKNIEKGVFAVRMTGDESCTIGVFIE